MSRLGSPRPLQLPYQIYLVLFSTLSLLASACQSVPVDGKTATPSIIDPFDYNYCGGIPVYPVIGVNFATYCGPSNHVVLGRTGKLMWHFPPHGDGPSHQGTRQLDEKELKQLSLLAEVVQLTGWAEPGAGTVNYRLGVNFRGRKTKRLHAVLNESPAVSNQLFRAMLGMVPDKPALPLCDTATPLFDPLPLPGERRPITMKEIDKFRETGDVSN